MYRSLMLSYVLLAMFTCGVVHSESKPAKMPREDVVLVPAIGKDLCASGVFQANMVLQRDKPVNIWGWANSGEKVTVSFAGQSSQTTAKSDRSWKVTLKAIPANSKAQALTIKGKTKTLELKNILVGDVWVLGGQSNMAFPIAKIDEGELEIVSANFPQIRLLNMPVGRGFDSVHSFARLYEWSSWSSRHFKKGDWQVCTPETVRDFSAIGYVFGRRLQMASQVPIGLINTSIGGTTLETWTPAAVLAKIKGPETKVKLQQWKEKIASYDAQADLQKQIDRYEQKKKKMAAQGKPMSADSKPPTKLRPGPVADRNRPGFCYAGVIRPIEGLSVKGAVFHHGYNNCFDGSAGAKMYYQVFGKMISAWRSAFNDAQMPFCIISLCTGGAPQTMDDYLKPMYDVGVLLREAQYRTFLDFYDAGDKAIGFVSSFDMRKSWYHPQIKVPVGERVAKWALVSQYEILKGESYWLPPTIKEVNIDKGSIRMTMSTSIKIKDESESKMRGFAIAGKDRIFYPADVNWYTDGTKDRRNRLQYKRDILVLNNQFVPAPVHFRYAWARNPISNMVSSRGIPLATQRSDDWLLEETPVNVNESGDKESRQISGEIRKILVQADIERRLKEAEAAVAELKPVVEKAKAKAKAK